MTKIRVATIDDLEQMMDCKKSVWESWRGILPDAEERLAKYESSEREKIKDRVRRFMENPDNIVLVAEEENQIVGFVEGNVWAGVSYIAFIGVRPEHRGRGIGTNLLKEYIRRSRERGAHKVYVWTQVDLKSAIKLYLSAGFVPEGFLRRHFYKKDMMIFSKLLE